MRFNEVTEVSPFSPVSGPSLQLKSRLRRVSVELGTSGSMRMIGKRAAASSREVETPISRSQKWRKVTASCNPSQTASRARLSIGLDICQVANVDLRYRYTTLYCIEE